MTLELTITEAKPAYYVTESVDDDGNERKYFNDIGDRVTLSDGHVVRRSLKHGTISVQSPFVTHETYKDNSPTGRIERGFEKIGGMSKAKFMATYKHCPLFVVLVLMGFKISDEIRQERQW